jgi:hypothetical protein
LNCWNGWPRSVSSGAEAFVVRRLFVALVGEEGVVVLRLTMVVTGGGTKRSWIRAFYKSEVDVGVMTQERRLDRVALSAAT